MTAQRYRLQNCARRYSHLPASQVVWSTHLLQWECDKVASGLTASPHSHVLPIPGRLPHPSSQALSPPEHRNSYFFVSIPHFPYRNTASLIRTAPLIALTKENAIGHRKYAIRPLRHRNRVVELFVKLVNVRVVRRNVSSSPSRKEIERGSEP